MRPRFLLPALAIALIVSPITAGATDTAEQLAEDAVQANPRLAAFERQAAALEAKADAVQLWMDPMFAVEYSNFPIDSWSMGDSPMTGIQLKLQQTFPFPGKNERREAVVLAEVETKLLERDEAAVQLRGAVRRSFLSLALVRQLEQLTEQHIQVVHQLQERVRLRYEVGQGNQQDLLNLSVLEQKLADELGDFRRQDTELTAAINGALHRDTRKPIATPDSVDDVEALPELSQLMELAKQHRPRLALIKQRARTFRLAADQADYERRPDFSVWLGYRVRTQAGMDDGTDFMSIGASIPIPFNYTGSFDAKKTHNLEMAAAVGESYEAALDEIATEIARQLAALERADGKRTFYSERLLPETRLTLEAALTSYETGRAGFFSIYRAEYDLINFERIIATSRVKAALARVAIETQIGTTTQPNAPAGKEAP